MRMNEMNNVRHNLNVCMTTMMRTTNGKRNEIH